MRPLLRLASAALELLAPRTCVACLAASPTWPDRNRPVLCATCAIGVIPAEDPPPGVVVPYAHGGPLAHAVHHAKYGEHTSVARQLGELFAHSGIVSPASFDIVVPVPLHPRRLAHRGFNQAVELSRALDRPIALDAVVRVRDTRSQVGLDRAEREANVRDAFAPARSSVLRGRRVLVLDDVVTTGATLAEVVRAVRVAGAQSVVAAAVVRAPLGAG